MSFSNLKDSLIWIHDWSSRSRSSDKSNAMLLSSQLNGSLSRDCITGIKDSCSGNRSKHSQIFQSHLRGTIFSNRDPTMRSHAFDVCLRNCSHSQLIEGSREEGSKGRHKWNGSSSTSCSDSYSDQVLFCN